MHPGIRLLLDIAAARPELLLTGQALSDQGRAVTVMLAAGWSREHLRHVIAGGPLLTTTRQGSAGNPTEPSGGGLILRPSSGQRSYRYKLCSYYSSTSCAASPFHRSAGITNEITRSARSETLSLVQTPLDHSPPPKNNQLRARKTGTGSNLRSEEYLDGGYWVPAESCQSIDWLRRSDQAAKTSPKSFHVL